jgi:hypothetical protein
MDPILTIFGTLSAASVVGAVLVHAVVRRYFFACVMSALVVGLTYTWAYAVVREHVPHWTVLIVNIVFAGAIALGIGIPFNRRRTGRGLGRH